jgi:type IV pilus assembly protein PilA
MLQEKRGFTLIELLVVIAIIGVLSAVVLASLNTSRSKSADSGVRTNMRTIQTQAGVFADDRNVYGVFDNAGAPEVCPAVGDVGTTLFHDSTVENAIDTALRNVSGGTAMCQSNDTAYAVAITRPVGDGYTPPSTYWCVDSTGAHCGVNDNSLTGVACGTCVSDN